MCRKPIIDLGVVEKIRSLLQSAEGAGQLLLSSLAPQGVRVKVLVHWEWGREAQDQLVSKFLLISKARDLPVIGQ